VEVEGVPDPFKRDWEEESPDPTAYPIIGDRENTARRAMKKGKGFLDMPPPSRWKQVFIHRYGD